MSSLGQEFANLYRRELDRLADEISAYDSDADLWSTIGAQKNPAGTLALHTVGALLSMIGASLGGTGYVRDRDREFSERGTPKDEIVRRIHECRDVVVPILEALDDATLSGTHPGRVPARMEGATTRSFLAHLLWHTGWHLGQVNYHRQAIAAAPSAGAGQGPA